MLECKEVCFSYPSNQTGERKDIPGGVLRNVSCTIEDGSFVLLCGTSGCGKTTLTRLFNGLIPHYYEGEQTGSVYIDGEDYKYLTLFDLSKKVGSVFQNPRSGFYNVDTTSEIAFGCENQGMSEKEVRKRVEKTSEQLDLTKLLGRSIFSLSGGEKQKIACGSAAAVEPDLYVLDEPSSNLDAEAITDLRELLKIFKSQGKTVVIAEHRLYYLWDLVDRVIYLKDGTIQGDYTALEFLDIPEIQKEKMGLRPLSLMALKRIHVKAARKSGELWNIKQFHFAYRSQNETLSIEDAAFSGRTVTAVIGHNGAGKTTFSRCLCGLEKRCRGVLQNENASFSGKQRLKQCYMVMQDVNHQLFTESVLDEVLLSLQREDPEKAELILEEMDLLPYRDCHPMGLSGGQKQRVAIASAIASDRPLILFDEPTSGLDLFHMRQVADSINKLADSGKTIIIVTHDPEFILRCCDSVIQLEKGKIADSFPLKTEKNRNRLLDFFIRQEEHIT